MSTWERNQLKTGSYTKEAVDGESADGSRLTVTCQMSSWDAIEVNITKHHSAYLKCSQFLSAIICISFIGLSLETEYKVWNSPVNLALGVAGFVWLYVSWNTTVQEKLIVAAGIGLQISTFSSFWEKKCIFVKYTEMTDIVIHEVISMVCLYIHRVWYLLLVLKSKATDSINHRGIECVIPLFTDTRPNLMALRRLYNKIIHILEKKKAVELEYQVWNTAS